MNTLTALMTVSFMLWITACTPKEPTTDTPNPNFDTKPTASVITPANVLNEASGLVDSKKVPGHLWSHEDAASPDELTLIAYNGQIKGKLPLPFGNLDWEDLAIGPGPVANETYLYLAEIGDNASNYAPKVIYRFVEPTGLTSKVSSFEAIKFKLPDGTYDCETILFDPKTKDIFVITKWLTKARVYRLAYPQKVDNRYDAEFVGEMTVGSDLTGGSMSVDGREIIVRAYTNIYYWQRKTTETVAEVLKRAPTKILPYVLEPQGEAVAFKQDGTGYFTLSERRMATAINLYFYKRI